jgi:3-oxoacyl-[acyl-carrier-protein] synthase-1
MVNSLGAGMTAIAPRLFAGEVSGMVLEHGLLPDASARVGRVASPLPAVPEAPHRCRNNALLLAALEEVRPCVDALLTSLGPSRIAVVLGTSTSGMAEAERAVATRLADGAFPAEYDYRQQELGEPARYVALHLGITGPAYTVSTACTSSAKAIAAACRLLNAGVVDAVITGGADSLCRLTVGGFTALESTSPDVCNPMSRNRRGINVGEGAALLVLVRAPQPFAILGVGESSDAHHISAPDPTGAGAERAMRSALAEAGVQSADVGYVNLHATATVKNDEMEALAMSRVFPAGVPASGTKPLTGHTLGAAGAIEAAFCWLALVQDRLPPHVWDGATDPQLPALDLVTADRNFNVGRRKICMSNSYAFGGSNASLVLGVAA